MGAVLKAAGMMAEEESEECRERGAVWARCWRRRRRKKARRRKRMRRERAPMTMPAMAPPLREEEDMPGSELREVAPGSREPEREEVEGVDVEVALLARGVAVDDVSLSSVEVEEGVLVELLCRGSCVDTLATRWPRLVGSTARKPVSPAAIASVASRLASDGSTSCNGFFHALAQHRLGVTGPRHML